MEYKLNKKCEDVVDNMLMVRGLSREIVEDLLNPTEDYIEDIYNYKNMQLGLDMLHDAIKKEYSIATLVDSDCDGYCSSAVVYDFILNKLEYENVHYMLHEDNKAHGLNNEDLIKKLVDNNIKLIIIPDASIDKINIIKKLHEANINVLILDHHYAELHEKDLKDFNNVVWISNKDNQVENIALSGCGVTYKFIKEYSKQVNIELGNEYIDLVSLSVVSDICDMISYENRYYYELGRQVRNITNPLLIEFCKDMKKNKKDYLTDKDLGFGIAPSINAIIRMGSIDDRDVLFNAFIGTTDLIMSRVSKKNNEITYQQEVIKLGNSFKRKQKKIVEESLVRIDKIIKEKELDKDNIIVLQEDIDREVRGLLANKLIELYNKPIFILTEQDGLLSGSVRGKGRFKTFCENSSLFEKCVGHLGAFGVDIKEENIEDFIKYANENLVIEDNILEVERVYESNANNNHVKEISAYSNLFVNNVRSPKFLIKDVVVAVDDIKKIGNSTYTFIVNGVVYRKDFGSLVWYSDLIKEEEDAEVISIDILAEFKNNCVFIIDTESKKIL